MRTLVHHPISTLSRIIRLIMKEKHLEADERIEPYWMGQEHFLVLNPAGEVPVLVEEENVVISGGYAIVEYLEEVYPEVPLVGSTSKSRAEARRLLHWFESKFNSEVTEFLAGEKLFKRLAKSEEPDSRAIRAGRQNIHAHLEYIAWLTDRRRWLAGDNLSVADLAAGAHISLIDYTNDVPWEQHPLAKEWYARLKSRPCFRPLLGDVVMGISPAPIYANLDF